YPDVEIVGHFHGSLDNSGEELTLASRTGATIDSVSFRDGALWPLGPDGFGFTLIRVDLDSPIGDPDAWRASAQPGGSPGSAHPGSIAPRVLISEILPESDPPFEAAIELVNLDDRSVDIGGWFLSDTRTGLEGLAKFRIPDGTSIPAGERIVFYASDFAADPTSPSALSLPRSGGAVYLTAVSGASLTGHILGVDYEPVPAGEVVSYGLHESSTGLAYTLLDRPTFGVEAPASIAEFRTGTGAPNSRPRVG